MINFTSFHDELTKIAEEYDNHGDNFITKDRLKRLGKAMLAVGAGAGLGHAVGEGVGRYLESPKGYRRGLNAPGWVRKYGPALAGAMVVGGGMIALVKDPKHYIKHGDKSK